MLLYLVKFMLSS